MDINITVFFQAIQFFIAFFFIYIFLFIPACKALEEQEIYENTLQTNVQTEANHKLALLNDLHEQKLELKMLLMQAVPCSLSVDVFQCMQAKELICNVDAMNLTIEKASEVHSFLIENLSKVCKK